MHDSISTAVFVVKTGEEDEKMQKILDYKSELFQLGIIKHP